MVHRNGTDDFATPCSKGEGGEPQASTCSKDKTRQRPICDWSQCMSHTDDDPSSHIEIEVVYTWSDDAQAFVPPKYIDLRDAYCTHCGGGIRMTVIDEEG